MADEMQEIQLPEKESPPTLADQLRGALYTGASYHWITKVTCGDRTSYIVPAHIWEKMTSESAPAEHPAEQV